jgi:tetratricopeptide (TPR) repeat protein
MKYAELYEIFEDTIRHGNVEALRTMNLHLRYPNWQSEFGHYKQMRDAIELQLRIKDQSDDFKHINTQLGIKYFSSKTDGKGIVHLVLHSYIRRFAAMVIFLLAAYAGLYYYSFTHLSNESILASVPLIENTVVRSAKPTIESNTVKSAFSDKNYNQVIDLLEKQDLVAMGKPDYFLYLGASYYHLGQYESAIITYRTLLENSAVYPDDAYMNITLCYLKQNDVENALKVINEAINNPELTDSKPFEDLKRKLKNPLRQLLK